MNLEFSLPLLGDYSKSRTVVLADLSSRSWTTYMNNLCQILLNIIKEINIKSYNYGLKYERA